MFVGCSWGSSPGDWVGETGRAMVMGPDLSITSVNGPSSVLPWDGIMASVTVCNHGNEPVGNYTDVELYLSSDAIIDPQDHLMGVASVDALHIGACQTVQIWGSPGVPDGGYQLGALVDPANMVVETDENNNQHADASIGVGEMPDLEVTALDTPLTVSSGDVFDAQVTVCNRGNVDVLYPNVDLFLSTDTDINTFDEHAGSAMIDYLSAGACQTATIQAYASTPNGVYHVGVIADPWDSEVEFFEDNNVFSGSEIGVGSDAELVVTAISGPQTISAGYYATFQTTVCNYGQSDSGFNKLDIWLSPDPVRSMNDYLAGETFVDFIRAGACINVDVMTQAYSPDGVYHLIASIDTQGYIPEIFENNNDFTGDIIGVGNEAELVITEVSGPASAGLGGQISVTVTACNVGQTESDYAHIDVVLSNDSDISMNNDHWVGADSFQHLNPTMCVTRTIQGYVSAPEGVYNIGAIVDSNDTTIEMMEDNNTLTGDRIGIGYDKDLIVASVSGPTTARPWSSFDASVEVCNVGQDVSSGADVEVVLSSDAVIDMSDAPIGNAYVNSLSPGDCSTVVVHSYTMNPGAYTLGAIVDRYNTETELIDDNNATAGGTIGIGDGADWTITAITGPSVATPYSGFDVHITACNQGQDFAYGADIDVYLVEDPMATHPVMISYLEPGQCETTTVHMNGPSSGTYTLGATIDPYNNEYEILESNNTFVGDAIAFGWEPDLVVTAISGPVSAAPGQYFDINLSVCNQGFSASYNADVHVYLSTDDTITTYDIPMAFEQVGYLDAGACETRTVQTFGPYIPGGYRLGSIVDPYNVTTELLDNNNTLVGADIGIGHDGDLTITSVTGPATATPYGSFTVDATVCNYGQATIFGADMNVYLSSDSVITDNDMISGNAMIGQLDVGQCQSVSVQAYGQDMGIYTLGAIVDPWNSVLEILDSNNASAGGLIGFGHDADLTITAVSAPASAIPGGNVNVDVTVCNPGQSPSYSADVELYLSNDAGYDSQDPLIGMTSIGYLDIGACATVQVSGPGAMYDGRRHVIARVDPHDLVLEIRDDNNVHSDSVIVFGYDADLVITDVSAPASAMMGQPVNIDVTMCNQGQTDLPPIHPAPVLDVYLSSDSAITTSDMHIGGNASSFSLMPGACTTVSVNAFINEPGQWVVGAIADGINWVYELDDSNNSTAGNTIDVM